MSQKLLDDQFNRDCVRRMRDMHWRFPDDPPLPRPAAKGGGVKPIAGLGTGLPGREQRFNLGEKEFYSRAAWKRAKEFLAHGCHFVAGYDQGTLEHDHQVMLGYGWFETLREDMLQKERDGYRTYSLYGRFYWFPDKPTRPNA